MRKPSRTFSVFLTLALLGSTVAVHAQETDRSGAANTPETGTSDLTGILATARRQLPSSLDAGSFQTYLDGVAAYIYGYSLLAIAMTERVSTNVGSAGQPYGRAPLNQLFKGFYWGMLG